MNTRTFRHWLRDRGCSFEEHAHRSGAGHPTVTARRLGKRADLPAAGARDDLDPADVEQVVRRLGLDPAELPRTQSRV